MSGSPVVYTTGFFSDGIYTVSPGQHFHPEDGLVKAHPEWFSEDARFGMSWSGEPPEEMREPPIEQVGGRKGEKREAVRRG